MKRLVVTLALATVGAAPALAADSAIINKEDLKWGDVPNVLPKGGKIVVLHGDPFKPGSYALRLMMPANYKIAPHWHTKDENLTVLSGTLQLGMGEKMGAGETHDLKSGGYHYLPGKTRHYALAKGQTVVQLSGDGPFDIHYLNAADDPSKAGAKKTPAKK